MKNLRCLVTTMAAIGLTAAFAGPRQELRRPPGRCPSQKFSTPDAAGVAPRQRLKPASANCVREGGVPDAAGPDKLLENLIFQRAVQAYLLGLPPVNQLANRQAILTMGPADLTVPLGTEWSIRAPSNSRRTTTRPIPGSGWICAMVRWCFKVRQSPRPSQTTCGIAGPAMWSSRADQGCGRRVCSFRPAIGGVPAGYHVIRTATLACGYPGVASL